MNRIRCLLIKEWTQLMRDPNLLRMLIIAPVVQLIVMGFAANTDIRNISLAIRDQDHTPQSREYVRGIGASGYFTIATLEGPDTGDDKELIAGRAGLILVIPPGFGSKLAGGKPADVQALVDGSDSNFGVQGISYLQKATRVFTQQQVSFWLKSTMGGHYVLPEIVAETQIWYNPDLTSRYYMGPAIMALLLMVTTMMVTSMALVKEREDGTLEQIIVTPLRSWELIIGKLAPFVAIGYFEITLAMAANMLILQVPFKGNILLLYGLSGIFLLCTLGLGLFVSTLVKTQQQAMMVSQFFVMMPFILLSGFAFPVENMPPVIRAVSECIPLRHYLVIIRGIFLKGVGLADLWPQALFLLIWGIGILTLASLKFHKRLD